MKSIQSLLSASIDQTRNLALLIAALLPATNHANDASISPMAREVPATGGSHSVSVNPGSEPLYGTEPWAWDWHADGFNGGYHWNSFTPTSGSGSGTCNVTVQPNPNLRPRTTSISFRRTYDLHSRNIAIHSITQEGAPPTLLPDTPFLSISHRDSLRTIEITANPDLQWRVRFAPGTTIQLASYVVGTGSKSAILRFLHNPSTEPRTGTLILESDDNDLDSQISVSIPVYQFGKPPTTTVGQNSFEAPHGGSTYTLQVTSNVAWEITDIPSWITVTPSSGSESSVVTITVAPNSGDARTATLTINGETHTITQGAAPAVILSDTRYFASYAGDAYYFEVTSNVSWTAVASHPWIHITSGQSGTGNGLVAFEVDDHFYSTSERTGSITVNDIDFTITQESDYFVRVNPENVSVPAEEGSGTLTVDSNSNWTATPSHGWIRITSGESGSGDGSISFEVDENTTPNPRTGMIFVEGEAVIGEEIVFVSQAAATPQQKFDATIAEAGLTGPDAALGAIPHGDGVANLLKYAFNLDLTGPDTTEMAPGGTAGLPGGRLVTVNNQTYWRVEFVKRKNSGLVYTPVKSSTLAPDSFVPLTATPTVKDIDADWQRVAIDESCVAPFGGRCFSQVRVTLP